MRDRPFRFGVVATPQGGGGQWRSTAQRVAELGYSTLLMPDGLQLLAPLPSLATAAAVADLRVGTFVLAGPLRPPRSAAWEAHSLTVLTDGRFELGIGIGIGIGTGVPAVRQSAERLGLPCGSAAERLAQVEETIDHLRELDGATHTPVLIAAGGPRARALAAAKADIVTLAADRSPPATRSRRWQTICANRPAIGPVTSSSPSPSSWHRSSSCSPTGDGRQDRSGPEGCGTGPRRGRPGRRHRQNSSASYPAPASGPFPPIVVNTAPPRAKNSCATPGNPMINRNSTIGAHGRTLAASWRDAGER